MGSHFPWDASWDFYPGYSITNLKVQETDGGRGQRAWTCSKKWAGVLFAPSKSGNRSNQLASLRNKIKSHADSTAHKKCVETVYNSNMWLIFLLTRKIRSQRTCRDDKSRMTVLPSVPVSSYLYKNIYFDLF